MNSKKILVFTTLSSIFIFIASVFAAVPPSLPHTFYGNLYLSNGDPAPAGLTLVAKINNTEYGSTTTSFGKYDYLLVTDPTNTNNGKTIYFYVSGIQANPTYVFKNGGFTELNLTLTAPLPTTTTTTAPSRGGGGGGGGGGGSTTTTTTTTIATTVSPTGKVKIEIVDLIIPSNITANESFDIVVTVKNTGDIKGSDEISLSLPEGWTAKNFEAKVTLKPGDTKKLYFTIIPDESSGEIEVSSSSDVKISETIKPKVPEKAKPLGITGFLALASGYWWIIIIIAAVLLLVYFARRKPSRKKPYEYKRRSKKK